jgi:hypothetical protein
MPAEFSDPAWWPKPPPKPPRRISTAAIVFGTILPLAVIAIVVVAIVNQRKHSTDGAAGQSLTAFEACMRDQGAETPSERSNSRFLQQAAVACRGHLPKGMQLPSFTPAAPVDQATQQAFEQCMQEATANLRRRGPGGLGGSGVRQAFENAIAVCRRLVEGHGASTLPPETTTSQTPAVA